MQLEKNISQLLYCHDCVIVPEFGGFVANYRSAWVDELRQKVHPPSKEIGFNQNLKRNDGLLVDHLAQAKKISFDEAGMLIAEEVGLWNQRLKEGRLDLNGVGGLYYDRANNLHFDPDRNNNYLTAAFGMGAVQLPELKEVAHVPEEIIVEPIVAPITILPKKRPELEVVHKTEERSVPNRRIPVLSAVAATITLLIAFGFWLNAHTSVLQDGMAQVSGLNPFISAPAPVYTEHELEAFAFDEFEKLDLERSEDLDYFNYSFTEHRDDTIGRVVEWNKPEPADPVSTLVATPSAKARYHVVGGCFSEESNAHGLIGTLQAEGYDPKLIDKHRGLYRVAVGSYVSKQHALQALAAVRKDHTPSAWLLIK